MENKQIAIILCVFAFFLIVTNVISYNLGFAEGKNFDQWKAEQYDNLSITCNQALADVPRNVATGLPLNISLGN